MKVPLLDLQAQYRTIRDDVRRGVDSVLENQHFILGDDVQRLESAIAAYAEVPFAIGCASGSDALLLALMAIELKPEEGVITVPFTFFATVSAITRARGHPFFVDIDPATYNMSPDSLKHFLTTFCVKEKNVTKHIASGRVLRAIIPVHLFGQCADMEPILVMAKEWNLVVIEDAAQAIGARHQDRPAGSMGDIGCFSFFPSKNLGGAGDGGMVVTKEEALAEKLRVLRVHGSKPKYFHKLIGLNSRLDTIQAAVLLVKLAHLDRWTQGRRTNAVFYDRELKSLAPSITTPFVAPGNSTVYNQYCIRSKQRDALRDHLKAKGIGTEIYYPLPLHLQECFSYLGHQKGDFPESEKAAEETLALPIYPELTDGQKEYVVTQLKAWPND